MGKQILFARLLSVAISANCSLLSLSAQVNVLTNRYNQSRTAANLNETTLTPANVNTTTFGKLGTYAVDGVIYAQPLYVQGLTINGVTHNVLFVGTMHDVMYAFDADKIGSSPLWTLDFRSATVAPAPIHIGANPSSDASVADTFGILGTPVIDLPNNRMFFVTHTLESRVEHFRLRSVNILTGALNASTDITASVPAVGSLTAQTFVPAMYGQRPALELVSGQVWVGLGSRPTGDYLKPWQGWLLTYNANTLAQSGVFVSSRTSGNSFWQSGSGPAVDASGNVFYLTANGGTYTAGYDLPQSLLQFNFSSGLNLANWYTPDSLAGSDNNTENYTYLDEYDLDLSCNGPVLIPGTDLVTFGSKTGDVFVLNTGNLGKLMANDPQLVQFFHVGAPIDVVVSDSDRIVGMAYWQQGNGGTLYVWPGQDALHAYSLNTATSAFTNTYAGTFKLPGQPSTALAISANGSTNGILWAPVMNVKSEANVVGYPGILHAYNAANPSIELWNSNQMASDNMGTLAKFVPPVVVNGKVYIANSASLSNYSAGSVTVYGLKVQPQTISFPPIAAHTAGTPATLNATASSGLAVSYASLTAAVCTVAGSEALTLTPGECTIVASQAGNSTFAPAAPVSQSFSVTALTAITAIAVTPNSGEGKAQAFAAAYFDPNGASGLVAAYLLFNTSIKPSAGCYAEYYAVSGLLFLKNDAGTGYATPSTGAALGSATTLANSQCSVSAAGAAYSVSGDTAILTLPITFSGYAPTNSYLYAAEKNGTNTGWVQKGTWGSTLPPAVVSVSPDTGTGATQAFATTISDPNGGSNVSSVFLLANTSLTKANGCYVEYYSFANLLYLKDNTGTVISAGVTPGSTATVSNSQCTLAGTGSSYNVSGNTATLTVNLTFKETAAVNLYVYATDKNGTSVGWVTSGSWTP